MKSSEILSELRPLLIDAIPRAVGSLRLKSPAAVLRIYYFDTTAPCGYLTLRIITEKGRAKLLKQKGRDATYYLWSSGEVTFDKEIDLPNEGLKFKSNKRMIELFAALYDRLMDRTLASYRKMLQEVARTLNSKDWRRTCPVTDDFAIATADGSQAFADEHGDLVKSIPPDRLKLLRQRGLLGPGRDWDHGAGFETEQGPSEMERMVNEIDAKARSLPVPQRIDYWVDQLDRMADHKDNDMKRIEVNDGFPLDRLGDIGAAAAVPILKLAQRLFRKKNNDDAWTIMVHCLFKVRDMGHRLPEVETLLRQLLKESLATDELTASHCARALHQLFKKYPEPERGPGDHLLANAAAYLG